MEITGVRVVEVGGLHFEASFRAPAGATLRVSRAVDGQPTELLRFDDFIESPHYHVPAQAGSIPFSRENGEPLTWYVSQIRDHLAELLTEGGFASLVPEIDLDAVSAHAGDITKAMEECVPEGYVRVPGVGLQKSAV